MGWGYRVCKRCHEPYDVCSGECAAFEVQCEGCLDCFPPSRVIKCTDCERLFCDYCLDDKLVDTCDGCGKVVCDHQEGEEERFYATEQCFHCGLQFCQECTNKAEVEECEGCNSDVCIHNYTYSGEEPTMLSCEGCEMHFCRKCTDNLNYLTECNVCEDLFCEICLGKLKVEAYENCGKQACNHDGDDGETISCEGCEMHFCGKCTDKA